MPSEPFTSPNIVARTSRWIDHKGTSDLRLYIDDFFSFVTRPYTITEKDGALPHFYRDEPRHFANVRNLRGSALCWFLFLRVTELPYFVEEDEFGTVSYSPQRVMRQFGFDQHRSFGLPDTEGDSGDYKGALENFISSSNSFSWEIPIPSTSLSAPLLFIIPSATRQGQYSAIERNRWDAVTKLWQDDTVLAFQAVSPPRQSEWAKLLCAPKSNTHPEKWPVSTRLLDCEASRPQPSSHPDTTTSCRHLPQASSHAPPQAPPQGPSAVEERRITRSRARGHTAITPALMPPVETNINPSDSRVIRQVANGTTIILKPFSKRPTDDTTPSTLVCEDPTLKRRKLVVAFHTVCIHLLLIIACLSSILLMSCPACFLDS